MQIIETELPGVYLIQAKKIEDDRGFFTRTFCVETLAPYKINTNIVQNSLSYNRHKGTFRGMHYQTAPFEEEKFVSCTGGAIVDFILDLRPDSPSYLRTISAELSAENLVAVYIPKGCAHGFQTLEDHSRIFYQMTEFYHPESARGIRYNDPKLNIQLPVSLNKISEKDLSYLDTKL